MTDPGRLWRATSLRSAFPAGVAAVRQLVAFGVPERTVYNRCLDGGTWRRILPGVVLLSSGRPTRDQQVAAALLLGGPDAVVTGIEACRRHGLRRGPLRVGDTTSVHVLVPESRQVRSVGFVLVERTKRLPPPRWRAGVPLAPLVRACTDAARGLEAAGDVAELLSDPVQRGFCTVGSLAVELDEGSRRRTAVQRAVLADLSVGIRSAAEREARKLWSRSGLPEPWWNASVYDADDRLIGIADCWLDDVAMVWEIESSEWHLSPGDHDRTVERAAAFVAAGAVYTASKPKKVLLDRPGIIAMLRATHAQAAARPRPALRAEPAPPA